jgi:hypothetical protein
MTLAKDRLWAVIQKNGPRQLGAAPGTTKVRLVMDEVRIQAARAIRNNNCRAYHDRDWWCIEARRLGSDWPGLLRLQAEVIAAWRARHDPDARIAA